ncbi:MAG: sugar phosphate isomerase/epimerase [Clostridia bacterium]|nr:sugar phosphate isomerase/epimerase [Clostridia bacterium]
MRIGLSSYSLDREIQSGRMDVGAAIEWAARHGAECMELVPFAFRFDDPDTGRIDEEKIRGVRRQARDAGIPLVNYSVLADFCREGEALEKEIARVKHEVDIAAALGVPRMRHDVSGFRRPQAQNTAADFDRWLPVMADAAREVTRHGRQVGVNTLIENHGFFANGCDRVERVLRLVNDENYGLLLDTGNVVCVDEDAQVAAAQLAPLTRMVHLKDFYIRTRDPGDSTQFDCAGSWFRSRGGKYLRGAILAQGDLDIYAVLRSLKAAGYDGDIAIEFEGLEDAPYASAVSIANAKRIWEEA